MTVLQKITDTGPIGVCAVQTPLALSRIFDPGCAAVIWDREPVHSFQCWLDGLDPEYLPSARLILHSRSVQDALHHWFELSDSPDCPERSVLIDDIAALADIFAHLMGTDYLRLRLDVVSTNSGRKFHEDTVSARPICTYRGTGTQYGVSSVHTDPEPVYTAPTCAPIVLRGSVWPSRPRTALRHLSPPIEGTGETRLVLVLDPIADLDGTPATRSMTRH